MTQAQAKLLVEMRATLVLYPEMLRTAVFEGDSGFLCNFRALDEPPDIWKIRSALYKAALVESVNS